MTWHSIVFGMAFTQRDIFDLWDMMGHSVRFLCWIHLFFVVFVGYAGTSLPCGSNLTDTLPLLCIQIRGNRFRFTKGTSSESHISQHWVRHHRYASCPCSRNPLDNLLLETNLVHNSLVRCHWLMGLLPLTLLPPHKLLQNPHPFLQSR